MIFTEFELTHIKKAVSEFVEKKRPPEQIRHQVDITYKISDQSVEIIEVRSHFNEQWIMNNEQ